MKAVKKQKLALKRETLAEITPERLDHVAGGAGCWSIAVVCVCSDTGGRASCIGCK
jgi:hypothetical protein